MSTALSDITGRMKELTSDELRTFGHEMPQLVDPTGLKGFTSASLGSTLQRLPVEEKAEVLIDAIKAQPQAEREQIAKEVSEGGFPRPTPGMRDLLWLVVVSAFAIVLVGSFVTLAIGVLSAPTGSSVKQEIVLTMFTSVIGFLAGLFVPSPGQNGRNGNNGN